MGFATLAVVLTMADRWRAGIPDILHLAFVLLPVIMLDLQIKQEEKFCRAAFDTVKANASIGIPCFVTEDGQISFDTDAFIPDDFSSGASCNLDGKGC